MDNVHRDHDADTCDWNTPPTDMHQDPTSWLDVAEQGAETLRQTIRALTLFGEMPAVQEATRDHIGALLHGIGNAVAHDTAGDAFPGTASTAAAEPTWLDIAATLGALVTATVRTVKVAEVTDADPAVLAMLRDSLDKLGQAVVQAVDNSETTNRD